MLYNRIRGFAVSITCCLLLAGIGCKKDKDKIVPEKSTITESVYSSVTIQPDSLYQAYAIVAGILDKNLVQEGDTVSKGTPLLQIINNSPKLNTDNAKLSLQLARENYEGSSGVLSGIRDQLVAAALSLKNDSINYFRQKNLWEQNIGSRVEFDNRKLAYELSRTNLQLLKNQFVRTENELQTQVEQASNSYKNSKIATGDFTVGSMINGKVYALYKNPGEIVTTMDPLASVGSKDVFLIEMLVDEVDIVKLNLGQRVLITLDAYGKDVFEGKVYKIYPRKDERTQTFKVEARFDSQPKTLFPGLSGEGNIVIAQRGDVLTIPKSYLVDGNKVLTEAGLKEVQIGLQSLDKVEIKGGIDERTYLLKPEE